MTAAAALARAYAAGLAVRVEGGTLRLRSAGKPPPGILADLRTHKAELLGLLTTEERERAARVAFYIQASADAFAPLQAPDPDLDHERAEIAAGLADKPRSSDFP